MKRYVIIAGVNGAGKTTLFYALEQLQMLPRVNSDEFVSEVEVDDPRAVIKSGKIVINKINEFMENEMSFNQEATLCGKGIINNIKKARSKGYLIEMHYVGIDDVDIVKQQVQNRVVSGGHGISTEKIERRYVESLKNLKQILDEIDLLLLYDNTEILRCFATYENGQRTYIDENIPNWFYRVKNESFGTRT